MSILQGKTVIFLGSSVTYGHASGGVSFADFLAERNQCKAIKEAVSGTTLVDSGADSYISRMKAMKVEEPVDYFICQLSTNDATQKKPLGQVSESKDMTDFDTETIAGAMEYIIAYARSTYGCQVAFYTSPKYDSDEYQAMVDCLFTLQIKWGIDIIDLWNNEAFNDVSVENYARYMADPIHPTREGYLVWWTPEFEKQIEKIFDLSRFYQDHMYGQWREGETVTYTLGEENALTIHVEANGKKGSFDAKLYLPKEEARAKFDGKSPVLICMHPIQPKEYALEQGYAVIELNTLQVASDDCKHVGCFYDLYPYGEDGTEQTGVLMAWAWAASKALDAVYAGLNKEANLDENATIVTGVSRWGKATAVCGAFDKRFTVVMPTCSGAGGLALNQFVSEGNTYDFTSVGGPQEYTYTQNEPLSCLQSEAERGWFNDAYLNYHTMEEIPKEQYMLPVMAMQKGHYYVILAACMGEDWVNAPAMWECYKEANAYYTGKGLGENLVVHFHKEGHAVLQEDLEYVIPYINKMHYGMDENVDMKALKTSVFAGQD